MSEVTWDEIRKRVDQLSLEVKELGEKMKKRNEAWDEWYNGPHQEFLEVVEEFRSLHRKASTGSTG